MSHGKWYISYSYHDTFRGIGGATEYVEIPLNATTEDDAIVEAKTKWCEEIARAHANWEEKKRTWAKPPASPLEDGPWNPCVIYKIPLS